MEVASEIVEDGKQLIKKQTAQKSDETDRYFQEKLEKLGCNEDKVSLLLEEMKLAISQEGKANFKLFWKAKELVLGLFKETLHPMIRSQYWNQFVELSNEARQLKSHLEEATSFALEQIALAITALQEDLKR